MLHQSRFEARKTDEHRGVMGESEERTMTHPKRDVGAAVWLGFGTSVFGQRGDEREMTTSGLTEN